MKAKIELEKQHEIVRRWITANFKDKEVVSLMSDNRVICKPLIRENCYLKPPTSTKTKIESVTFRYKEYSGMPQTGSYQIVYKLLRH